MLQEAKRRGYGEDFSLAADMIFNGTLQFGDDNPQIFFLRRMAIRSRIGATGDSGFVSAYDSFQACDVGAISSEYSMDRLFLDGPPEVNEIVFGGRRRPLVADLRLLRKWLEDCGSEHGKACQSASEMDAAEVRRMRTFRLIDVKRKAIQSFEDANIANFKYVALSYMWGKKQRVMLVSQNESLLSEDNALDCNVSRTIADAINLVRSFGLEYLWVDALCILQDSDSDKKEQISNMDMIYKEARLTVIAASGDDADAGLPGLTPGSRTVRQEEVIVIAPGSDNPGLSIVSTLSAVTSGSVTVPHPFSKTKWNTRGWTLQERALSLRVLTFTEEQIYWACQCSQWCEDTYAECSLGQFSYYSSNRQELSIQVNRLHSIAWHAQDPIDQLWQRYQVLVSQFGEREFSFEGDAHDAFAAILKEMSRHTGERFLWGIPASRLELGLNWSARGGAERRDVVSTLPMTSLNRRVPFPSWSWLGWKGPLELWIRDDRVDMGEEPEVMCYIHRNSPLRLVRVGRLFADTGNPNEVSTNGDDAMLHALLNEALRGHKPMRVTLPAIQSFYPHLTQGALCDIPDDQLLFFWTGRATFTLHLDSEFVYGTNLGWSRSRILDQFGKVVGSTGFWGKKQMMSSHYTTGQHCFIQIGSRRVLDYIPQVMVLQVEERDGIFHRVNTAEIEQTAWEGMSPSWTIIALG